MTDLEALERTAKAARDVGEAWLTHDDLTGVYPEVMAFIVEASPAAVLSLLSAHRAALEKCERLERIVDSQYHAGAKAGWNAAQSDDPKKAWASLEARAVGGTDG